MRSATRLRLVPGFDGTRVSVSGGRGPDRRAGAGSGDGHVRVAASDAPVFDPAAYPQEAVPCALCGGEVVAVVADRDRYGLAARTVRCVDCGLEFLSPRMTAEGYAAFYRQGYRPLLARYRQQAETGVNEDEQWVYAAQLAGTVGPFLPASGTLLDVGGSTGVVARLFRARWGFVAIVIDPAPDELARARDCGTICASAETVTFPPADVALLCRTVEHLLDPRGVLERLREAAPLLVVDAMDTSRWPASHRYKVDHPYAFTQATLERLVRATGWTPVHRWARRDGMYVGLVCRRAN